MAETLKHRFNQGLEGDVVFEQAGRQHCVECRSGSTCVPEWLEPARRWRRAAGATAAPPLLLYGGDASFEREDHRVLRWRELGLPA